MVDSDAIRGRLTAVRDRIERAASRAGRDPSGVRLVAVSKTFSAEHVRVAFEAGQLEFGENRVQEAEQKIAATSGLPLRWHLVGHLQSNKARRAATSFNVIQSVDQPGLVTALDAAARAAGCHVDVLIQVALSAEPTKHGAAVDALLPIFSAVREAQGVHLRGLMLLPAYMPVPEDVRPAFAALRALQSELTTRGIDRAMLAELSMGMSRDFEIAVEEGATIVRVGSAIFGPRHTP